MESSVRPSATAGVVVIAAGMIAATPALGPLTSLPGLSHHRVQLTAGWQDVLDAQLGLNSALINGFFGANRAVVDAQHSLTPALTAILGGTIDDDGVPHGLAKDAVEQFFNANNAASGAGQAALLGLLGARGTTDGGGFTPLNFEDLNTSLLVDPQHDGSIPFAGLESAIGHYIGAAVFLGAYLSDTPGSDIENGDAGASFTKLIADVDAFNQAILDTEKTFNTDLVANEIGLEKALFGTDSAFNGVINRAFNAFNMVFDVQQQGFNGLLGVTGYDPQDYTTSLLTGSDQQTFNDGSVGGLLGMAHQSLAAWTNLGGLLPGDGEPWTGDGLTPDPGAVVEALQALAATLGGGMFGDVFSAGGEFSELLADLQALFAAA